jgi:hypothetical protein
MTSYRIVCTTQEFPTAHQHITSVGTGTDANRADKHWTVADVRRAITTDTFYTADDAGNVAFVGPYDCPGCGYRTIRSLSDAVIANALDYLPPCRRD